MILVTGGTGLLGTHLLYELISAGYPVRALHRESSRIENTLRVFCWKSSSGETLFNKIEWVKGDVLDYGSLTEALDGVSQVFHCAAVVSFDTRQRKALQQINTEGTANMVNAALAGGIKWFCHVSSVAALGSSEGEVLIDESTPWKTESKHSDYSMTKYAAEREVWRGIEEGLNAVIVNPSVILGPGPRDKAGCMLFRAIAKGIHWYPSGGTGFVDVRDVVEAMLRLMKMNETGQRFVVSGANHSYQEVLNTMARLLNKPLPKRKMPDSMFAILWVLDFVRSLITFKRQVLTREIAKHAIRKASYDTSKIRGATGLSFHSLEETLEYMKDFCFHYQGQYCLEHLDLK